MAFQFSERALELQRRVKHFIDTEIIPQEAACKAEIDAARRAGNAFIVPHTMERLKAKAKEAGLWNLFLPESGHGAGLSNLEYAPLCELMGRVPIASKALRIGWTTKGSENTTEPITSPGKLKASDRAPHSPASHPPGPFGPSAISR